MTHLVPAPPPDHRRVLPGFLAALGGLVLLVASGLVARGGTVGPAERRVFHAVNDLPQWLYRPMWLFQQFGNLVVAFVLVLGVALVLRRPRLAAAAVVAVVAKLAFERAVKSMVERARPGTSIGDVVLRGDVSRDGLSFVSGHAVITTACATMLMAVLPRRWRPLPWAIVVLNGLARIYVGAHNPLDVVGGVGLGLVIGGLLYAALVAGTPVVAHRQGTDAPSPEAHAA
ncbi:MAG: phosphatase PAP2 family protein [Actinomycetota bacterium]|nr:phosphatase PAP2 family protein [Actinomycetota bacterium]